MENEEHPKAAHDAREHDNLSPVGTTKTHRHVSFRAAVAVAVSASIILSFCTYLYGSSNSSDAPGGLLQIAGTNSGQPASAAMSEDSARGFHFGGRALLVPAMSLQGEAGSALAWLFDTEGVDLDEFLRNLAKEFDISGEIVKDEWQQTIGSVNGLSASAWVTLDSYGYFGAYDPRRSPWNCIAGGSPVPADAQPGSISESTLAPATPCNLTSGTAPTEDSARQKVRKLLQQLGFDLEEGITTTARNERTVTVSHTLTLDGYQLPWSINAEVSSDGIFSLNGTLARPRPLPNYPVVNAITAAKRSLDPRWSTLGPIPVWDPNLSATIEPMPMTRAETEAQTSRPGATPPATSAITIEDGRPVLDVPVHEVNVVSAKMSLGQFNLANGSVALLPAWEFLGTDGTRWSMLAIEDRYINFTKP